MLGYRVARERPGHVTKVRASRLVGTQALTLEQIRHVAKLG